MQVKTIVKAFEAAAGADNVLSEPADLAHDDRHRQPPACRGPATG